MGKQVMGIKEGTCCDEHWILCGSVESPNCIPETILYCVNWNLNNFKETKTKKKGKKLDSVPELGNFLKFCFEQEAIVIGYSYFKTSF